MESTATGPNRTGAAVNPAGLSSMLDAVNELSPPIPLSTLQMDVERQWYVKEADSVGSISPPHSAPKRSKGTSVKGSLGNESMSLLLDKIGERIAFERTGTRLYDA